MHVPRWFLPLLVSAHVTAITVASVPAPRDLRSRRTPAPAAAPYPAAFFDGLHQATLHVIEAAWPVLGRLRNATRPYVRAIGLEQRWNMFAEPPDTDQYAHMRYYIRSASGSTLWVARELIFPASREDVYRPFGAAYYEEKAVRVSRQRFMRNLRDNGTPTQFSDLPKDLLPLVRFYSRRYEAEELTNGESIARAEIWLGSAPVSPPGVGDPASVATRMDILRAYHEAPRMQPPSETVPIGTSEREADITWTLMYAEARR